MKRISHNKLKRRLEYEIPNNSHPVRGYALVSVIPPEDFRLEHIPHSLNIPDDRLDGFECFDRSKEIIIYGKSPANGTAPRVTASLISRGFNNVIGFEEGMQSWKDAGYETEGLNAEVTRPLFRGTGSRFQL